MPLRWVKPERHPVLGLACPCPGRESGLRPHVRTPGAWAAALALGQTRAPCGGGASLLRRTARPARHMARLYTRVALPMGRVTPDKVLGLACPVPKANRSCVRTQFS